LNVLEVSFAEQVFTLGRGASLTLGIIYAVTGIGTGLGPILMRHWLGNSRPRLVRGIMIGFALVAIGIFIISQSPDLLVFSLGTLVRTVGSGTVWVFSAVLLQSLVPDEVRGRVFAFEFALLTLTQSMSILWAGVAQDSLNFDVFTISLVMSGLGVAVWLVWSLLAWRSRTAKLQFDEA
jgi:MFS family permease